MKKNKTLPRGFNDFEEQESYIMEKKLIVEAWSKYRPNSAENSPVNSDEGRKKRQQKKNIEDIYDNDFLQKLIEGVKQKRDGSEHNDIF